MRCFKARLSWLSHTPLPAGWWFTVQSPPVQTDSLLADMGAAARRIMALLAAAEAGLRLQPQLGQLVQLASGPRDLFQASAALSEATLKPFGLLLAALVAQHHRDGVLNTAAAEPALRAVAGLAGTLLKLLRRQGGAGGGEAAVLQHILDSAMVFLQFVLVGGKGTSAWDRACC